MSFIIGEGSERDSASIKLETKKKRWINNAQRFEKIPEQMRAAKAACLAVCPGAKTRSLSNTYNCYGLVFAARRTWVDEGEIEKILDDDGYKLVKDRASVRIGDVITYRKREGYPVLHVGIIWEIRSNLEAGDLKFVVLSQWGGDGEYIHPEDQVHPLFGNYREYYSERRLV